MRHIIRYRAFAVVATALALVVGLSVPALATQVSPGNSSYDRPGITTFPSGPSGGYDIAWAGTDANGEINVATLNSSDAVTSKYTDTSSSTYYGTGAAIAYALVNNEFDNSLVAWTDLNATVHIAAYTGAGLACESTGFGSSYDTPYLTETADGTIYVTTVDGSGGMHITEVTGVGCITETGFAGSGTIVPGSSVTISGNSTYVGPTLLDLNLSGTPDLWLVWAGTNSAHNINIAKFTPGSGTLGTKYTESSHSTITDFGGTNADANGTAFFTYCGTNHVTYGQFFDSTGPGTEETLGSDKCDVYTSSGGYTNGGIDVTYNTNTNNLDYLFANTSYKLTLDSFA